jgi:hypothetical protein
LFLFLSVFIRAPSVADSPGEAAAADATAVVADATAAAADATAAAADATAAVADATAAAADATAVAADATAAVADATAAVADATAAVADATAAVAVGRKNFFLSPQGVKSSPLWADGVIVAASGRMGAALARAAGAADSARPGSAPAAGRFRPWKESFMSVVPESRLEAISFCETHDPVWTLAGEQIGIAPDLNADFSEKTLAARTAVNAMKTARAAALAATAACDEAVAAMRAACSTCIQAIRFKAQASGDPGVYDLAQIPRPKPRAPVAAPGQPNTPAVKLLVGGSLKLSWKCSNPADGPGVRYEIHRQDGTGAMTLLTTTSQRTFTDATLPAGSPSANYLIRAIRSDKQSEAMGFLVQFGTGGAGSAQSLSIIRKAA